MRIEPITPQDVDELTEMAREAHRESKYSHFPFSELTVRQTFEGHMLPGSLAIKAVGAEIAGFLLAGITGMVFTSIPIAMETSYWVKPEHRGGRAFAMLMLAFNDWSKGMPQFTIPHFGADNSKTYSALEKLGYREVGKIYARGI